jgi:predicted metal-dependent phosphoesterase TrpH
MQSILKANSHIHTPYSFSAFESVEQAVKLAREQNIAALGISDFNTYEGYKEFAGLCAKLGVYPLFNMELITLIRDDKDSAKRWNDGNPGIIYYCAKALDYPVTFSDTSQNKLKSLWEATQQRMREMIHKLNAHMADRGVNVSFDFESIRRQYAKNTVRERHLARAVYNAVMAQAEPASLFKTLFADKSFSHDTGDAMGMQNEIRARLIKAGKPCYVEEGDTGFMTPAQARELVLDGGGIPCYPIWVDDKAGLTEYENDPGRLATYIRDLGIHLVEFIPVRNTFDHLKNYVRTFVKAGFPIVFGTEHNTPRLIAMEPKARNETSFDEELYEIAYQGACVLAAHQEMRKQGRGGFVNRRGERIVAEKSLQDFVSVGDTAVRQHQRTHAAGLTSIAF